MKKCTSCGYVKPLADFYRWKRAKDGRQARCSVCVKKRFSDRAGKCCDCGGPVSHARVKRCQQCRAVSMRSENSRFWKGGRSVKDGYVRLSGYFDHPNAVRGHIAEHTLVMTQILGRALFSHEEVHHKNGVRDDNSPGNLELWSVSQPAGQRVEDKLEWARGFIKQYKPEWLEE